MIVPVLEIVWKVDVGIGLAVNCFPAAVLMGLNGHELPLPAEVEMHLRPIAKHQALREVLLKQAGEAQKGDLTWDEEETLFRMRASLQNGKFVWEEVSMFVVELFGDKVTVNVIMGVTAMEALTVTSFAGEKAL